MSNSQKSLLEPHESLEIEQEAVGGENPTSGKKKETTSHPSQISISLCDVSASANLEETEVSAEKGYIIGAILMITTTLLWTIIHIASKYLYTLSPEMTGFDIVSVMAYTLVPVYYTMAKIRGVNCNLFSFEPKLQLLLVTRILIGLANNIVLFVGLQYVSVGKGILIWSLSPLFCAITASIFLKEKITFQSIALIFISIGGVYLLTLNKAEDPKNASNELLGYALILSSAFLYGVIFVMLRTLNLYKIDMVISPLYFGTGTLIQNIVLMLFIPDLLHIPMYFEGINWIFLGIVAIGAVWGQYTWIAASKYSAASKMAPIGYSENVLTLLADVLVFNYHFVLTDLAGISIIVFWILFPIVQKLREE